MRKFVLLIIFINLNIAAYNQLIKGIVLDQKTRDTISFATIYFNGTFVGTNSDVHGRFELDISKNTLMPLTISAIGYYSVTLTNFSTVKPITIYMAPKVYELSEVVIKSQSHARERIADLREFKNEFLGTTSNANQCEILNENEITFNYGSDQDILKAYASKPIIINNKALGYKITYFLDQFEYDRRTKTFIFKGNIIFNEAYEITDPHRVVFERKRKHAYLGSRTHFFNLLWENKIESSAFAITSPEDVPLDYSKIVFQDNNNRKFLRYSEKLKISYYKRLSIVVFLKSSVYFDKNGYYDPTGISWEGDMADQRIADMLPLEYSIR